MQHVLICVCCLSVGLCGCASAFHEPSRTTIHFSPGIFSQIPQTLGFEDALVHTEHGTLEIVAYGWGPREHIRYAKSSVEPYPTYQPRLLHIECNNNGHCAIEIYFLNSSQPAGPGNIVPARLLQGKGELNSIRCHDGAILAMLGPTRMALSDQPQTTFTVSGNVGGMEVSKDELTNAFHKYRSIFRLK